MNSSQFMDKQIMGLAASGIAGSAAGGGGELFDLMNPQGERHNSNNGGGMLKKEEILPSYDFQPIRTVESSSSAVNTSGSANLDGGGRHSWGSADSKIGSATLRYSNILETHDQPKVSRNENEPYDVATVAEIDRTVKKYADDLLHALEGVSSRLSQLETRTRHLESSVEDLKDTIGSNTGSTDGKLRQLENILREVQTGVQVLRDRQEIAEAQLQLAKLQSSSKADHYQPPSESANTTAGVAGSRNQPPPPLYAPAPPTVAPSQQPPLPTPNAPPPPPPAQQQPPPQFTAQLSQAQLPSVPSLPRETPYFPTQGAQPMQPQPQSQPPPHPQHYQVPQYSQQMPPPQVMNPSSQLQPPVPHHPEESYMLPPPPPQSQIYPPAIRQPTPSSQPPPASGPPQYYGSGQLPFPSSHAPPPGPSFSDSYPYSGSPSHYSSTMKPSPFSNSPPTSGGGGSSNGSNYSRLPTAKILPQAVPTGTSSGGGSGNRIPIDDVVDKVATMGFSREQVRATVRRLTENGQSVDLNVVLDKLMNGGGR